MASLACQRQDWFMPRGWAMEADGDGDGDGGQRGWVTEANGEWFMPRGWATEADEGNGLCRDVGRRRLAAGVVYAERMGDGGRREWVALAKRTGDRDGREDDNGISTDLG
ncbi:hypothetical protein RHGRI_011254 [Rhododendron griersonianum]|uniref:Uncharacterized protein n=1 Tax=Rhododendron griersonianum TaxID=479676 RepID=A0AAV6KLM1_9ERIC|nr:hypothetical protein RHGRI_011254 [Rhododendron griersonianum]